MLRRSGEQITTLTFDPTIEVRPKSDKSIDDLLEEIDQTIKTDARVLVTTLTKRMQKTNSRNSWSARSQVALYSLQKSKTLDRVEILRE